MSKKLFLLIGSAMLIWSCQSDKKEDAKEFYSDLFDKQEESSEFALTDEEISGEIQEPEAVAQPEVKVEAPQPAAAPVEAPKAEEPKVEAAAPIVTPPAVAVEATPAPAQEITKKEEASPKVENLPQEEKKAEPSVQ